MAGLGQLDKIAQKLSVDLLNKLGGTCDIEIAGDPVIDPYTHMPTGAVGDSTTIEDIACLPPEDFAEYLINDTTILSGDAKTGIANQSLAGNTIKDDNSWFIHKDRDYLTGEITENRYKIIKTMPVSGGNSTALIEMQIRR